MEPADTPLPAQTILTLEEALARGKRNYQRLVEAGLPTTRNIEARLAWKRARGIDTTVEEWACGLKPPPDRWNKLLESDTRQ